MKLAALGVITAAIGIGLDLPGLIGIGAFWVVLGPLLRQHGQRLVERQAAAPEQNLPVDRRTFAVGTALWALLGVPSLLVGLLEIGMGSDQSGWRWLPLVVGILALGIGGLGLLLSALGGAALAVDGKHTAAQAPATLWISSVKETGTFINERPRMEFELRVEPDAGTGLAPYSVTKKASVPFTALYALRPGDGFRALVAGPDDPTTMEISWEEPVTGER